MIIAFVKFLHLIIALSLLGLVFLALFKRPTYPHINKLLSYGSLFALLTGTLLIYPKHYTFRTPWIDAAYLLIVITGFILFLLKKYQHKSNYLAYRLSYGVLALLLMMIVHDAVMKSTFLF